MYSSICSTQNIFAPCRGNTSLFISTYLFQYTVPYVQWSYDMSFDEFDIVQLKFNVLSIVI